MAFSVGEKVFIKTPCSSGSGVSAARVIGVDFDDDGNVELYLVESPDKKERWYLNPDDVCAVYYDPNGSISHLKTIIASCRERIKKLEECIDQLEGKE